MSDTRQPCLATGCKRIAAVGKFCEEHHKAPSGKKGGWISAAKRRPNHGVRAIDKRLWIGPTLSPSQEISHIDMIVLCAEELQPDLPLFSGKILRCPLPHGPMSVDQGRRALLSSAAVAHEIKSGRRVIITCDQTLRRCSFVAALALCHLTTMGHEKIIDVLSRGHGSRMRLHADHDGVLKNVVTAKKKASPKSGSREPR